MRKCCSHGYVRAAKIGSGIGSIKWHVVTAFAHEGSEVTYTGSLHNAEILSASTGERPKRLARPLAPPIINGARRIIFRSTGTREIGPAKRIGAQIIESFWSDAGRGAEKLKLRNDYATIGQLLDHTKSGQCNARELFIKLRRQRKMARVPRFVSVSRQA